MYLPGKNESKLPQVGNVLTDTLYSAFCGVEPGSVCDATIINLRTCALYSVCGVRSYNTFQYNTLLHVYREYSDGHTNVEHKPDLLLTKDLHHKL